MSTCNMKKLAQAILVVTVACVSTATLAQREANTAIYYAETDRFLMWYESQKAAERAEQAALAQAEATKKAEEAAEELRDEMEQAAIRTKNNIYLGVLFLFTAGFVTYIIRKSKEEKIMQENQKFGIAVIIGSALVILLSVIISDNWVYKFDFLQNLMSWLRIRLFANEEGYLIDVQTKYVVLAGICAAAYGLTTYLGITPVPIKKAEKTQGANTDLTS